MIRNLTLSTSCLALGLAASAALAGPDALTAAEARHLVARTGFGAAPHEVEALTGLSRAEAVDRVISGLSPELSAPMPAWTSLWPYPYEDIWTLGQTADELFFTNRYIEMEGLAAWWMAEMVATPSPLTEKLTLFWHDHFATSFEAFENSHWMADQHRLFRSHAAGNFAELASAILRDPAMLAFLTNIDNSKDAPNENLAREYFELFTLGEGRGYTEADIRDAARALTGHSVAEQGAPVHVFYTEDHDRGQKTILGQTGRFDADDLPVLALAHPEFGPYIVEKLWRLFISDQPDPDDVQRLSDLWKANNLEMKPLLEAMFLSDAFWDPANRGRLVKSPIEMVVGASRSLGLNVPAEHMVWATEDLGQVLFFPPNVGGWPEGAGWINDAAALSRSAVLLEAPEYFGEAAEAFYEVMPDDGQPMAEAGPNDFRVGQVFATWAEAWDGGIGLGVTLYDVSVGGQTYRSFPMWIEAETGEAPFLTLHTGDCAPSCFASVEDDAIENGWLFFSPVDYAEEGWPAGMSEDDEAMLSAILTHLPDLFARTENQQTWSPYWEDDLEEDVPDFVVVLPMVGQVAEEGVAALGRSGTSLVLAQSQPGTLGIDGLAGMKGGDTEDVIERYYQSLEDRPLRYAVPAVSYQSAEAWVAALPEGMTPEAMLLATSPSSAADAAGDAEEQIRQILLSPEFQLN